jgi:NMD protein affecting ribosome stability and mRNA decay
MRRKRSTTHPAATQARMDRMLQSLEKDAYGIRGKLPDPTVCPTCGAMYRKGRWTWGSPPADAHRTECPACRRTADDYPAGIVTVSGEFAAQRGDEIRSLARHVEEREKKEHALKRIMSMREEEGALVIATTNARLARGIGEALSHAYHGELDYRFSEAENVLRVHWTR